MLKPKFWKSKLSIFNFKERGLISIQKYSLIILSLLSQWLKEVNPEEVHVNKNHYEDQGNVNQGRCSWGL
jgi:hypothetical protein